MKLWKNVWSALKKAVTGAKVSPTNDVPFKRNGEKFLGIKITFPWKDKNE